MTRWPTSVLSGVLALCLTGLLACRRGEAPVLAPMPAPASAPRDVWHHPLVEGQIEPFATSQIRITPRTWQEYTNLAEILLGNLRRLRVVEVDGVTLAPFLDAAEQTLLSPEASPEAFAQLLFHIRRGAGDSITAEGLTIALGRVPRDPAGGLPVFTLHARLEERSPETARPSHLDLVQCVIDTGHPRLAGIEVLLERSRPDPTIFTYTLARIAADDLARRDEVMTYAGPDTASVVERLRAQLWEPLIDERYAAQLTLYQEENLLGDLQWIRGATPVAATASARPGTASPELREPAELFNGLFDVAPLPVSAEATQP